MTAAEVGLGQISLRVSKLLFDPVTRSDFSGDRKNISEVDCLYPHQIRALSYGDTPHARPSRKVENTDEFGCLGDLEYIGQRLSSGVVESKKILHELLEERCLLLRVYRDNRAPGA